MDFNTVRRAFFVRGKESFGGFARGYFIWHFRRYVENAG
jgi:hypothetical protein